MTVERIVPMDAIQPGKFTGKNEQVRGGDTRDSISLSTEAIERARIHQVVELVKSAPDLDESSILAYREKINNPSYINEKIVSGTADRIMNVFGF